MIHRWKEVILAATMLAGFIIAEIPANVRDYTQTSAKYDLESYGGTGLVMTAPIADQDGNS